MRQNASGLGLLMRTSLGPDSASRALVREVKAIDANLAPEETITMQEQVERTTSAQRVAVAFLCIFGGLALLLAALGLYGVMSYAVS
jgi:putative ABC transport system permease protein